MATELGPGTAVAGFRIEATLARSGRATLYRAVDERLGRIVALRVLTLEHGGDATTSDSSRGASSKPDAPADELATLVRSAPPDALVRERFVQDARRFSAIDHPNVIPVYSFGEEDGLLYLAMRYVRDGASLRTILDQSGTCSPTEVLGLLGQAARALDAIHRAGVVHGAVTPENLVLSAPGGRGVRHLYLTNVGLTEDGSSGSEATSSEPPRHNPADDLAQLGRVVFEALSGTTEGYGTASLHDRVPAVPPAIDDVMARASGQDPARRYSSCSAFADATAQAIAGAGPRDAGRTRSDGSAAVAIAAARPPVLRRASDDVVPTVISDGPPRPIRDEATVARSPRSDRSRSAPVIAAAIVVAGVLVAGALLVTRSPEGPSPVAAAPTTTVAAAPSGTVRVGIAARPTSWDPTRLDLAPDELLVARAVFDPLMVDQHGEPIPFLAERVASDPQQRQWTVRLRPNISFHDGTPVNALAVQRSLEAMKAKPGGAGLAATSSIEALDELTVTITATEPFPELPRVLSTQTGLVVAPTMLTDESHGDVVAIVGSGPFRLVDDRDPQVVTLKRNARYWRPGEPPINQLSLEVVSSAKARADELLASDLDVALLPASDASTLTGGFASRPLDDLAFVLVTVDQIFDLEAVRDPAASPFAAIGVQR